MSFEGQVILVMTAEQFSEAVQSEVAKTLSKCGVKEMLTREEAMQKLRCSSTTIHHLMKNGLISYSKLGSNVLFEADEINKYLESIKIKAA